MTRPRRYAALAALVALTLSACASNDAKESDVVNAMEDSGLETEQAECIGNGIDEAFGDDQDVYNEVAAAIDVEDFSSDDLPEGTADTINEILADCIDGEGETGGDEPAGGEDGETTTTTAGDGDETTTTTAGEG